MSLHAKSLSSAAALSIRGPWAQVALEQWQLPMLKDSHMYMDREPSDACLAYLYKCLHVCVCVCVCRRMYHYIHAQCDMYANVSECICKNTRCAPQYFEATFA